MKFFFVFGLGGVTNGSKGRLLSASGVSSTVSPEISAAARACANRGEPRGMEPPRQTMQHLRGKGGRPREEAPTVLRVNPKDRTPDSLREAPKKRRRRQDRGMDARL
eukprot:Gb_14467 [translate_table: standard]